MEIVDLHVHSTKSDGSFTPSELVSYAIEKGLSAFALTDHDTTEGIEEAFAAAAAAPDPSVRVIPGIEFSTEYEGRDIHILGLDIRWRDPLFQEQLKAFQDSRSLRNEKMCKKLNDAGIAITYTALLEAYPDAVITRSHYADYLCRHGYVGSSREAFERYIGDHCPCFVPREKVTPFQAVELVLQTGGIPVLAHPVLYRLSAENLDRLTARLKESGLIGLEAIYSTYSSGEEKKMRALARKYGLLPSGGSDFHGSNKPNLDLATGYGSLYIPASVWEDLRAAHQGGPL